MGLLEAISSRCLRHGRLRRAETTQNEAEEAHLHMEVVMLRDGSEC
jgi:hypothetical protein